MLLFRSEEHIDRWSERTGIPRGESFSLKQGWTLARALYADRMSPTWQRKTADDLLATHLGLMPLGMMHGGMMQGGMMQGGMMPAQ